ncbi:MAG: MFS transporter [FCB group bacterium]|nr:MFS transporter [FCB group bacterium]
MRYSRHVPPLILHFLVGLSFTNNAIYPLYIQSAGGGPQVVGWFMATYYLAAILGRPFIGSSLNRWGVKPVLTAGIALIAFTPLLYVFANQHWLAMFSIRLVQGLGFGAYFSAFFTLAAERAPDKRRTEMVGIYGLPGMAANLVGPGIGEWIVRTYGMTTFFTTLSSLGLLALLAVFRIASHPHPIPQKRHFQLNRYRPLIFPFTLSLMLSFSWAAPMMFLAPLAGIRHLTGFGLYFTAFALSGIVLRLVGRSWADRFGWRRILIPAFSVYGVGLTVLVFSHHLGFLIFAGALVGAAHGLAFPAVTALAYNFAPRELRGAAMALSTGMLDLGGFSAGLILGWIAENIRVAWVFPVAASIAFTAAFLVTLHVGLSPQHRTPALQPSEK